MKSKRDIYISMSSDLNFTEPRAKEAVEYIFDKIGEYLSKGEKVQLRGIGNFEVRIRAERKGRNPQTGEAIIIKSSKAPVFKSGTALKELVNK
jgi:DNA-binding protein HU